MSTTQTLLSGRWPIAESESGVVSIQFLNDPQASRRTVVELANLNRRDFNKLTMAAVGGLVAGTTAENLLAADEGEKEKGKEEKKGKEKEIHVCRGLNSCKGHGATGNNACAGQGQCATAKAHACHGKNACKNQGGCGATPGENACKGQGKCAVPLNETAWKKARAAFEAKMTKAGKEFGPAPEKKKKQA
jgi:hypothetical protein